MIANNSKNPKPVRCAIYTRKSTTEGLEQEFNSLDAQRESATAYIASQRSEGWTEVETRYDRDSGLVYYEDAGGGGGLLADIKARRVDCVVVYKVDRLSRSLLDFTKIMETLDASGCSFVSVTQQFNTTSSMGRLTLNILLSFAQFEREIISERTRDKMGAARRKGKYVGGRPMLGYDLDREMKRLVVNQAEAHKVRQIFELYLEHDGLIPTVDAINERGWRTKSWITKGGKPMGGAPFGKNSLHGMLTNCIYIGKVAYRDELYEGQHEAIVTQDLFDSVQSRLRRNRINVGDQKKGRSAAVLAGLIHCTACNSRMTHATSGGSGYGKRYRYYVCNRASKRGRKTCPKSSLPAEEIERFVIAQLQSLTIDESLLNETCNRVHRSIDERRNDLRGEHTALLENIRRTETAINTLSRPASDPAGESLRLDSLASLSDQLRRDQKRSLDIANEIERIENGTPNRMAILKAITDLQTLWDHLTIGERSRLLRTLVERIDHDPTESTISITLSPTGLQSFNATNEESES